MDFDGLRVEERLLHVWRWLVDAESNLRSSRRQLDKLRDLRSEEMEVRKILNTGDQTCPHNIIEFGVVEKCEGTSSQSSDSVYLLMNMEIVYSY